MLHNYTYLIFSRLWAKKRTFCEIEIEIQKNKVQSAELLKKKSHVSFNLNIFYFKLSNYAIARKRSVIFFKGQARNIPSNAIQKRNDGIVRNIRSGRRHGISSSGGHDNRSLSLLRCEKKGKVELEQSAGSLAGSTEYQE